MRKGKLKLPSVEDLVAQAVFEKTLIEKEANENEGTFAKMLIDAHEEKVNGKSPTIDSDQVKVTVVPSVQNGEDKILQPDKF